MRSERGNRRSSSVFIDNFRQSGAGGGIECAKHGQGRDARGRDISLFCKCFEGFKGLFGLRMQAECLHGFWKVPVFLGGSQVKTVHLGVFW